MAATSPTIEGFRAAFHRPSLVFAEIAWRWVFGATASALVGFSLVEYFNSLPVSRADSTLLLTRQPALVLRALVHVFGGSLNRGIACSLIVMLALAICWIVLASMGRMATVRALAEYFRKDLASKGLIVEPGTKENGFTTLARSAEERSTKLSPMRGLLGLNVLRVAVVLGSILALLASSILASFVSPDAHPRPGMAIVLFLLLAGFVCFVGWELNWWLSLAEMFVVRNGDDALDAIAAAASLSRDRAGSVLAVSIWTVLAHLIAFSVASSVVAVPFAFIPVAPWRVIFAIIAIVTLVYFAIVNWLYIARLAGYVCIVEMPNPSFTQILPVAPPPMAGNVMDVKSMIDRDELILSDIPNLALEP
jgi:hypothetical protein